MSVLVFEDSRYQYRPLKRDESVLRIAPFKGIQKTDYADNIHVRLKRSDRLDIISFRLYGSTRFDWVLAEFNNIKFPIGDLDEFNTLIAPSRDTLFNIILSDLSIELSQYNFE